MHKKKLIQGLALINAAVFIFTVHFCLPRPMSFAYRNAVEHYFNARTEWSRAWVVLLVGLLISAAIVIMFGKSETTVTRNAAALPPKDGMD